jgi:hypothetical protein
MTTQAEHNEALREYHALTEQRILIEKRQYELKKILERRIEE